MGPWTSQKCVRESCRVCGLVKVRSDIWNGKARQGNTTPYHTTPDAKM